MKYYALSIFLLCAFCHAETTIQNIPFPNLKKSKAAATLHKSVALHTGKLPKKARFKQKGLLASKMTQHIFGESSTACTQLFFAAMRDLQDQALKVGSNKLANLESMAGEKALRAAKHFPNHFQCEVGSLFARVTLRADAL